MRRSRRKRRNIRTGIHGIVDFPEKKGQITRNELSQSGFTTGSKLKSTAPVEAVAGIGVERGKFLRSKGITTVGDLRKHNQNTVKIDNSTKSKLSYHELSRKEKRIQSREAKAYLEKNDPLWLTKSSQGKHQAVKRYIDTGRLSDFQREAEFESDLHKEWNMINQNQRAGGSVRIPDLWREMKNYGYSEEDFHRELFRLEKERIIDLQTASDHKFLKEPEKAIKHQKRGYIYYVVWRRVS